MATEYKLVQGTSWQELEEWVNFYLDGGWQLQGGAVLGNYEFAQAMIKEVTEADKAKRLQDQQQNRLASQNPQNVESQCQTI